MAKYKIKHTSIMHNKKVYAEGSIIELSDAQAKRLEDFVDLINEPLINNKQQQKNQTVKMTVKGKVETKSDAETNGEAKDNEADEGGSSDDN